MLFTCRSIFTLLILIKIFFIRKRSFFPTKYPKIYMKIVIKMK